MVMYRMSLIVGVVFAVIAVGCSTYKQVNEGTDLQSNLNGLEPADFELHDLGAAPELKNEIWLNTPEPLRLAELRGRVVLLEFWTFG